MVTFTDRVPTYPGRVRLTPVTGQPNVYDLTREDDPVVVGTPVNAALFGALEDEMVQTAYGSYTGDGSASKTFTFDFEPQFLVVIGTDTAGTSSKDKILVATKGGNIGISGDLSSTSNASYFTPTWGSTSVVLSDAPGGTTALQAAHILNSSTYTYAYFAVGIPS